MNPALLRQQIEAELSDRYPSSLTVLPRVRPETLLTGIAAIDNDVGGIPVGAVTEICGPGKTSIFHRILAAVTARGKYCAVVDATDSFCPASAGSAGVDPAKLLWVRCGNIASDPAKILSENRRRLLVLRQVFKALDILLNAGGFQLLIVDIADLNPAVLRKVPLNIWTRVARFIERKPIAVMFVSDSPTPGSMSSLLINSRAGSGTWSSTAALLSSGNERSRQSSNHTCVFREQQIEVELVKKRALRQAPVGKPASSAKYIVYPRWA